MNLIMSSSSLLMSGVSAISVATTAVSIGIILGGKKIAVLSLSENYTPNQKKALKILGIALMSLGLLTGIASSCVSSFFTFTAATLVSGPALGPAALSVGIVASSIVALASNILVIATFIKGIQYLNNHMHYFNNVSSEEDFSVATAESEDDFTNKNPSLLLDDEESDCGVEFLQFSEEDVDTTSDLEFCPIILAEIRRHPAL